MKLKYTTKAKRDMKGINAYIAKDNPVKADEFVGLIEKEIDKLIDFPLFGTVEELPDYAKKKLPNSRKYIIQDYIAHYTLFEKQQTVYITRVHHGSMQNYTLI
jgi:addiction module RelE/StbE family toxin